MLATYVPCTTPGSTCETSTLLGAQGICDEMSGVCLCPAGFEGEDDFALYNDCHVSDSLRLGVRVAGLCASSCCFLITFVLLGKLLLRWGILYVPMREGDDTNGVVGGGAAGEGGADGMTAGGGDGGDAEVPEAEERRNVIANSKTSISVGRMSGLVPPRSSLGASTAILGSGPRTSLVLTVASSNNEFPIPENEVLETSTDAAEIPSDGFTLGPTNEPPMTIREEGSEDHEVFGSTRREQSEPTTGFTNRRSLKSESPRVHRRSEDTRNRRGTADSQDKNTATATETPIFATAGRRSTSAAPRRSLALEARKTIGRVPRPSISAIKELSPLGNVNVGLSPNATYSAMLQERRRKRFTVLFVFIFLVFSLCMVAYESLLIAGYSRAENNPAANFFLAANVSSVCWGIWLFAYTWYGNMPSLASFGKLFNLHSILLTYPKLMKILTVSHLVFSAVVFFGAYFILPIFFPDYRYLLDTIAMCMTALVVLDFCIVFMLICRILLLQFRMLESKFVARATDLVKKHDGPSAEKKKANAVSNARMTVVYAMVICCFFGPLAVSLTLYVTFGNSGRTNLWLISQIIIIGGCIVCFSVVYIVVYRTAGAKKTHTNGSKTGDTSALQNHRQSRLPLPLPPPAVVNVIV